MDKERRFRSTFFSSLPGNWRQQTSKSSRVVSLGKLLAYLNPTAFEQESEAFYETDEMSKSKKSRKKTRRVVDHPYMKSLFSEVK